MHDISHKTTISRSEFIALMAALMAMNALAIDIMLPALPYMGEALGIVNANQRQLVVGIYVLGFGLAQIVVGPLSDRFGRKTPILMGVIVYIFAAFAAIGAKNFTFLLILRFVQGLGAAGTRVITVSIIRDLYKGRAMAEIVSLVYMVFMVIPVIAPNIGQLILWKGQWFYIFGFMGVLASVVLGWAWFRLPETLPESHRRPLSFTAIFQAFKLVFGHRVALSYGVAGMFLLGGLFGFITSAQQIYVDLYGLGALFPVAFAAMALLMSLSSFVNAKIVSHFGMKHITAFAVLMYICFAALLLAFGLFGLPPLWLFFVCVTGVMFSFGWAGANANALSMEPLGEVAGTASSVFGFMQTAGGALIGSAIGQQFNGSVVPLAGGYLLMGSLTLTCILVAEKGRLFAKSRTGLH